MVGDGGVRIRLTWFLRALAGACRPEVVDMLTGGGEDLPTPLSPLCKPREAIRQNPLNCHVQ